MNYIQNVQYGPKDDLLENDPDKFIKGVEIDAEFEEISDAIESKEDQANKGATGGYPPLGADTLIPDEFLANASEIREGVAELATSAEVLAGTDVNRIVTPAGLKAYVDQNAGMLSDIAALANPSGDRLLMWDDSADAVIAATAGTGIDLSGTTVLVDPTEVDHDQLLNFNANAHVDHTAVSIIAGAGLTGGGTIASSRTLNIVGATDGGITVNADSIQINLDTLGTAVAEDVDGTDQFLVSVDNVNKQMRWQDAGIPVISTTVDQTLTSNTINKCYRLTVGTNKILTLNNGIGVIGNFVILTSTGTGIWTLAGTATRVGANGTTGMAQQYSVVILLCIDTNTWVVFGDTQ